jgi:hypothetical protein
LHLIAFCFLTLKGPDAPSALPGTPRRLCAAIVMLLSIEAAIGTVVKGRNPHWPAILSLFWAQYGSELNLCRTLR